MKIYVQKFGISSIPLVLLIATICILTDKSFKEWMIGELLSYKFTECAMIMAPAITIAYIRRNKAILFGMVACAFITFNCDIFRFSNDPTRDIDIVFYFGAFFRMILICCIYLPFVAIGAQFGKNNRNRT